MRTLDEIIEESKIDLLVSVEDYLATEELQFANDIPESWLESTVCLTAEFNTPCSPHSLLEVAHSEIKLLTDVPSIFSTVDREDPFKIIADNIFEKIYYELMDLFEYEIKI